MSLWLCLRFSQLPLQCLTRYEEVPAVVLSKQRVLRANDCAASLGIQPGMGTATVRALAGSDAIQLLERDSLAERRALQQLCCWAYSITPTLHCYREDCLLLEIGGCLTLFKGLEALLGQVDNGIGSRGYQACQGIAATPKAAWLLSFAGTEAALDIHQPLRQRLAPLPLQLLDDFARSVESLRRAGLQTFADILPLPSAALGRRCGKEFTRFLLQALGEHTDLQQDYRPPETFNDEYWFGYEVKANAELLPAVQLLLQSLCQFLRNTQLQTGEIKWLLIAIDNKITSLTVRSSSHHNHWENWYQLTCLHIDQLQLTNSVEGIALQCDTLETGQLESLDLFSPRNQREPLSSLLDRLRGRLGLQAIEHIACRDEHLPEFALHTSNDSPTDKCDDTPHCKQRPFWLMPEPHPLQQHRQGLYWNGPLTLIYGPERIEDNWWQKAVSRDYYIARGCSGQHYWVYHNRLGQNWFIHGLFT